jgi:hypothetical protein
MRISEKVLDRSSHLSDARSPKPLVGQKSCIFSLAGTNDIHMDVATHISSPLQHCQCLCSNSPSSSFEIDKQQQIGFLSPVLFTCENSLWRFADAVQNVDSDIAIPNELI